MRLRPICLALVISNFAFIASLRADPSREQVLALMRRVGDWQWANLATESAAKNDTNTNWIRATFFVGDLALYRATKDSRYLDPLLKIAAENHWQPGRRTTKD